MKLMLKFADFSLPLVLLMLFMVCGCGSAQAQQNARAGLRKQTTLKQTAKGTVAKSPARTLPELFFNAQVRSDGRDTVLYIKGSAYAYIPGERPQEIFGVEGYNIRRLVPTAERDGYFMASREVVFYTDPKTGAIINEWENPFTKERDEVFHIANDPVNSRVRVRDNKFINVSMDGKREYGEASAPDQWQDYYVWHADIFPFYPLPGQAKNYTAAELFDFYVPKSALLNREAIIPNVMVSWTRVGQWLPWMKMDAHDGLIVYHARSFRYETWDELPAKIKTEVQAKFPLYMKAPEAVDPSQRNATSWTVYAEEMKRRQK